MSAGGNDRGLDRLRTHVAECEDCGRSPLPLERIASALDRRDRPTPDATALSRKVIAAAADLMAVYRERVYRRRVASSFALSLIPLPAVVFFNVYLLRQAYELLSAWLPGSIVAGVIVTYASSLLLLVALTYAALPLLVARSQEDAVA